MVQVPRCHVRNGLIWLTVYGFQMQEDCVPSNVPTEVIKLGCSISHPSLRLKDVHNLILKHYTRLFLHLCWLKLCLGQFL
jgi:hypothetical protein